PRVYLSERWPREGGLPVSLGGGLVCLDVMWGSGDAVPVTWEGSLVARCLGGSPSATTGFSVTSGNCAGVELSLVWPGAWSGPLEGDPVKSCLKRLCPVIGPTSDITSAASVTPLNTPSSFL